ncbi:hypothetical protein DRP07_00830 [Archaeoglobales archaeon]|nr:MAG: hypothetical protein DRP07_00830 [Archaeoglobales archaeon]
MNEEVLKLGLSNSDVFEAFVTEMKDYAIFLLDTEGKVVSWNKGAERIEGYTAEEVIGKHFSIFYTQEDVKRGKPDKELEIAKREGRYEIEDIRIRKDGSKFPGDIAIIPIFDGGRKPIGYIKAVRDLTEKKRIERIHKIMDSLLRLVTSEMDYDSLINEALKEAVKITDSKYGFFGLVNGDGSKLMAHTYPKEFTRKCTIPIRANELKIEEAGIWADAVREKRVVTVNDYASLPLKKLPEGHLALTRLLIVPVISEGKVVSLVIVANKDEDYTKEDAEMLKFFMTNIQGILDKKRTEETHKTLIENTGTAMLIIDSETKIKFANEEAEKLLKLPREKIVGKSWTRFVSKDELERMLGYHKLRDTDPSLAPKSYEAKLVDDEGNFRYVLLNVSITPRTKERIVSFLDVTGLRKTERMLKESEERYRTLFEKSRDGIVLTGVDMRIIDCNEAALELSGLPKDEVIGKPFTELGFINKEDLPYFMEQFYKGMRENIGTLELKIKLNGEIKWLEVSSTILRKNKEPYASLNIIRDITDRKKTENELKMTLERLQILHKLDMEIIEGKSFEELSKTALHKLRELLKCDVIGLFRYDENTNEIVLECSDSEVTTFEDGSRLISESRHPFEDVKRGEILNVGNILELEDITNLERELLKVGMRSYVHVPLIVRGELIGILCPASKKSKTFDEKLQFIKEISDQLAIALHEAKLFEMRIKALERIEKNIEEFAILVDHIRNPLAIISGTAELEIEDENVRKVITDAVGKIEKVVSRLDKGWLESEKIREFLRVSRED